MTEDSTHSIIHSARRFFGGTMLSRCSGLMRDVAMAFAFGTQESIAAFLVAFRFSHLLRRLFGEGALQTAFIPHFEALRILDPQRACLFFKDLFATLVIGLSGIIFISMVAIGGALLWLDLSAGNFEIFLLTLLLMPSLLFICLFGVNASLLQCEKRFFTSGVAPVAFNFVWTIGVIALWKLSSSDAMLWLAGWVIIACLCQWLITLPQVISILRQYGTRPFSKPMHPFSKDVRNLAKPLFLGIVGVAAVQVNSALDALFARYASGEGPAYLWYALRIQQLPLALFGIAIAGALLPPLTRSLKTHDLATYQHFLGFALRRSIAFAFPITIAIFVMGDSAIQLIYGRGDFNTHSVIGTTQCLWGYGIGLIPMTLVLILAPAFYATGDYRTPAMASVFSVILNVGFNFWFVIVKGYGTQSVAWSTSLCALFNVFWLALKLSHSNGIYAGVLWKSVAKVVFASSVAAFAVVVIDFAWDYGGGIGSTAWQIWNGYDFYQTSQGFFNQLLRFSVQFGVFVVTVAGVASVINATDLLYLAGRDRSLSQANR